MYTKHHQARRQKAMGLFGHCGRKEGHERVCRNMGGPLDVSPQDEIGEANQMLRNSASELGAKRGGAISHHRARKAHGGSLSECAYRRGGTVKGKSLSACAYKHGGTLKHKHKYKTHRHEDAAEDRKLIREELRKHDREMPHFPRSKMHYAKNERKHHEEHERRERFAMGGVGKIRHKQMTMSGKPLPALRRHRHIDI